MVKFFSRKEAKKAEPFDHPTLSEMLGADGFGGHVSAKPEDTMLDVVPVPASRRIIEGEWTAKTTLGRTKTAKTRQYCEAERQWDSMQPSPGRR